MGERRGMRALEAWCRRVTEGYRGVRVDNMSTSWRDGLAFCALIHHFRPDLIDFDSLDQADVYRNNELAFRVAERHLGIPALLDAEDMVEYAVPDRLSILTYLSQFYQAFGGSTQPGASPGRVAAKRSASSADHVSMSESPPVKVAAHPPAGVLPAKRREPCAACGLPVFLAERLLVGGRTLYHRSCFRCARCNHPLSLANCYETEDGHYCCETCPDEVLEEKKLTSVPEIGVPEFSDRYSADFESALESTESSKRPSIDSFEQTRVSAARSNFMSSLMLAEDSFSETDSDVLSRASSNRDLVQLDSTGKAEVISKTHQPVNDNTNSDAHLNTLSSKVVEVKPKSVDDIKDSVKEEKESSKHSSNPSDSLKEQSVSDSLDVSCHVSSSGELSKEATNNEKLVAHPFISSIITKSSNSDSQPITANRVLRDESDLSKFDEKQSTKDSDLTVQSPKSLVKMRLKMFENSEGTPATSSVADKASKTDSNKRYALYRKNTDEDSSDPGDKSDLEKNINNTTPANDSLKGNEVINKSLSSDTQDLISKDIPCNRSSIEEKDSLRISNDFNELKKEVPIISVPSTEDVKSAESIKGTEGVKSTDVRGTEDVRGAEGVTGADDVKGADDDKGADEVKGAEDVKGTDVKGAEDVKGADDVKGIEKVKNTEDFKNAEDDKTVEDVKGTEDDKKSEQEEEDTKTPPDERQMDIDSQTLAESSSQEMEDAKSSTTLQRSSLEVSGEVLSVSSSAVQEKYPSELNPFGDEEELPEEPVGNTASPVKMLNISGGTKQESTNPFGSSEDEEDNDTKEKTGVITQTPISKPSSTKPPRPPLPVIRPKVEHQKKMIEAPKVNLNPFWSDGEEPSEDDDTTELRDQSTGKTPVPRPRTIRPTTTSTPEPTPRRPTPSATGHFGSASSLSSLSSSAGGSTTRGKKKPAPPPPSMKELFPPSEPVGTSTTSSRASSPTTSIKSHSPMMTPRHRKKSKPAPPPPPMPPAAAAAAAAAGAQTSELVHQEKLEKDVANRNRQSQNLTLLESPSSPKSVDSLAVQSPSAAVAPPVPLAVPNKSIQGQWKRKKGPAPPRPIPQRRQIKAIPMQEVRRELEDIEVQQQELERQGVKLEQTIRSKFEQTELEDCSMTPDVEDLVLQLFELVNEKNELFRRQAELMYLRRQQRLEEEHADLEYQIRCLLERPEQTKTESDKAREEELIQRLVEVVERRNEIVECLEMDRLREAEEDHSIHTQLGIFAAKSRGSEENKDEKQNKSSTEKIKFKKDKKSKKHREKIGLKKGNKPIIDADKDIDESEISVDHSKEKEKKTKKKWFL